MIKIANEIWWLIWFKYFNLLLRFYGTKDIIEEKETGGTYVKINL